MKITKITMAAAIALTVAFASCKAKDADIQKDVQAKEAPAVTVAVVDGVATLTGEVADEAAKTAAYDAAKANKDVKSVVNNVTVAAAPVVAVTPPPASMTATLDAATQQKVKDGLKDMPGVSVTFTADKAVLSGEVTAKQRMTIMQMTQAANVKTDVTNLKNKK